ncbi:hypothetical protein Neosp_003261 [[Neocosmospora] mangrovei]
MDLQQLSKPRGETKMEPTSKLTSSRHVCKIFSTLTSQARGEKLVICTKTCNPFMQIAKVGRE